MIHMVTVYRTIGLTNPWKYRNTSTFEKVLTLLNFTRHSSSNNIKLVSFYGHLDRGTTKSGTGILERKKLEIGIVEKTKMENNMGTEFEVGMNIGMVLVLARKVLEQED